MSSEISTASTPPFPRALPQFDQLLMAVTAWAERQAQEIEATGRPLTPQEQELARRVRVRTPQKIRICVVPKVPFPENPTLREIGVSVGLTPDQSEGLTFGYGIYLREDKVQDENLLVHEFRHVAQYECLGSINAFMFFYLKELLHFHYGRGPLEVDARNAETAHRAQRSPSARD